MIYIGCHLSVGDGYEAMGKTMSRFGGNTFAWFTRNPRGGKTKPVIKEERIPLKKKSCLRTQYRPERYQLRILLFHTRARTRESLNLRNPGNSRKLRVLKMPL